MFFGYIYVSKATCRKKSVVSRVFSRGLGCGAEICTCALVVNVGLSFRVDLISVNNTTRT